MHRMQVVGVAEPRKSHGELFANLHQIKAANVFTTWKGVAAKGKMADAIIICKQDNMHVEPAIHFAEQKYAILLEKPMSSVKEECDQIIDAVKRNGAIFSVCHMMRYTRYTQKIKQIIKSGLIGDIVNMQHLEPVG